MPGRRVVDWLDERIGIREIHGALFARKIPRVGWLYTLGSVALFLITLQVVTGSLLATSYAPTPDHAFESVRYVSEEAPFGSLIRSLHVWGASAIVVALVLHLLRTFFTGAYKFPRELTWVTGVALFVVTLGLGFTGYLLPWNAKAYWATEVGIRVAEQAPLVGGSVASVLRGGDELGAQTLTRFYALHVLLLPAALFLLLGTHLFLVVRQGISAPPKRRVPTPLGGDPEVARAAELAAYQAEKDAGASFFPYTLAKDAVAIAIVALALGALAWRLPAEVGEIADPTDASFNPRPEWYFLSLFELLKYFPGSLESIVAIVLPTLALLVLFGLPFIDRSRFRHALDRPLASGFAIVGVLGVVFLTVAGARSPLVSAHVPVPPQVAAGRIAFDRLDCAHCHSVRGSGGLLGPDLALGPVTRDVEWMQAHFASPSAVISGPPMPTPAPIHEEVSALLAYVDEVRGGGPYSDKAKRSFRRYCTECHRLGEIGKSDKGPDLTGIGDARTRSFIHRYIEDPKSLFTDSRMPGFLDPEGSLSHEQIEDISRFLAAQHAVPPAEQADTTQGGVTP